MDEFLAPDPTLSRGKGSGAALGVFFGEHADTAVPLPYAQIRWVRFQVL